MDEHTVQTKLPPSGLRLSDHFLLMAAGFAWIVIFLIGTLVDSGPYRARFMTLSSPFYPDLLRDGLVVALSYTLTNVAFLCVLGGLLGTLGRQARLGTDTSDQDFQDSTSPKCSAVLRGFVVYLAIISGILILGDNPASPTQTQYVRVAGFASLLSFVLNWNPTLFIRLLKRIAEIPATADGTARPSRDV